ncbi:response regulator receiver protein [Rhodoferax lacus]|uniref:Response regulator receiver protein n=1 Tax=Rhodoferax lacus TaxID=2184758 RepID=A0A3E1RGV6_9BURK|nr:EAL domain-containing protein [Rhodoferax lacus]RFO97830.1 response regulator receiver protein [Rhodoferax lacus]
MKIVIVEDSELISSQIIRALGIDPRIQIMRVVASEREAIDLILALKPDAVLLDLSLSPGTGLAVLAKVRQAGIGSRVFVLTNSVEDEVRQRCEALGISGFYDKSSESEDCFRKVLQLLPPLPDDEDLRLQALYQTMLLDAPEQEEFDAITRLACNAAGTPMALISLVDKDRQWFLSHRGLQLRETSRSIAVCAYTINGRQLMEVPDLGLDARFADNPLVVGDPRLRFYAGMPLVLESGQAVGTLCVLDTQARQLSVQQKFALEALAHCVVVQMELRSKVSLLEREVKGRHAAEQRYHVLAMQDSLTQLPNRLALLDRLGQQIRTSAREASRFAFLFIDLDRFKLINDSLGHEAGDTVLQTVAHRLTQTLRESDTVARLAGDEFAAILCNLPDDAQAPALAMAQKINASLRLPIHLEGTDLHLQASIGIAIYPDHGDNLRDLMRHADLAMYQAKREGGGCSVAYAPTLEVNSSRLLMLEDELEQALEQGEIIAHYQPQLDLQKGALYGMEALARWQHPRLGLLGPDHFIPLAERRAMIRRIGARMLELSLAQIAQWDVQGHAVPKVAVNACALELNPGYLEMVLRTLKKYGLAPQRLEIEITESVLCPDGEMAVGVLRALRNAGVQIAVDDFGSGYSSLGQLRKLPLSTLKIDRSFVSEIVNNRADCTIVDAVVKMAHSLGLHTVAEGAETAQQLGVLKQLGCDAVQGYVHARPMAALACSAWLDERTAATRSDVLLPRIAVVDDELEMVQTVAAMLRDTPYAVDEFTTARGFLASPHVGNYHCTILDLSLPDLDFFDLIAQAAPGLNQSPLVLVSGHPQAVVDVAATVARSQGFIVSDTIHKPFTRSQLRAAVGIPA